MSINTYPHDPETLKRIEEAIVDYHKNPRCSHLFDGKVWHSEDGGTASVACSKCGLPEIYFDAWRLP